MRKWFLTASLLIAAGACSSEDSSPKAEDEASIPFAHGSPWPKFRGDAAQTGRSRLALSPDHGTARRDAIWKVETAKGIFSSPVIDADGTTFIGSADRTFYAIDSNGSVKWKVLTGEVVDSAAVLDDRGRVYFGSGDGKLRALDTNTGNEVWSFTADDPKTNNAFINWFEGNVTIGPSGTLYVPNDNFFFYAIDRDNGSVKWRFKMPDQTWSSPAIDPADETIFVGNNNVLPTLGKNTFAIAKDGTANWAESTLGSVAASPLILKDRIVVGAFDGWVRAYDKKIGTLLWETPTRDHIYASASLLPDGSLVQPSADGTIYNLDANTGAIRWTFDTDSGDSVRSSTSIDGEGNIYFGGGDGKLYVLRKDGTLRWSLALSKADRNDLNSSPALGKDHIVIAGESGEIFGVPWDYCLRNQDPNCSTAPPARAQNEVALRYVTALGATLDQAPSELDANEPITLRLIARENNQSVLGTLDASALKVTSMPPVDLDVRPSGDGKFVIIAPKTQWPSTNNQPVTLNIEGNWLRDHQREGLRLSGGHVGGQVQSSVTFTPRALQSTSTIVASSPSAAEGTVWEIARLALPYPTLMPSYNQIGFDSLHYLVSTIEMTDDTNGVAWMIGARLAEGENRTVIDPTTRALFPLSLRKDGDNVTFSSSETLRMEVMNVVIPFDAFRISGHLDATGAASQTVKLSGASVCATVPFYGPFLQKLGLCNPQTDQLVVVGGAELRIRRGGGGLKTRSEEGAAAAATAKVEIQKTADHQVRATLASSTIKANEHVVGLLLVDATTGKPIAIDYGIDTKREVDPTSGNITSVSVPVPTKKPLPASVRAHVIVDTQLLATKTL